MNLVEILREDYTHFPKDQTYSIYAEDVHFKDPLVQFRGVAIFQKMLQFMDIFFFDVKMDLHAIQQVESEIQTRWTLSWTAPLPWKPRMAVPGSSELKLNSDGRIAAHFDYWDCSRLDVLKQAFGRSR